MTIPWPDVTYVNKLRIAANYHDPREAWQGRGSALYMQSVSYSLDEAKEIRDAIDGVIKYVEGNKPKEPTWLEKLEAAKAGSKLTSALADWQAVKLGTGKWVNLADGELYRSSSFGRHYTLTEA